jgi:hypothetical protein
MLAPLNCPPAFQMVAEDVGPAVIDRRLAVARMIVDEVRRWRAAGDSGGRVEPARRVWITRTRRALLRVDEPADTHIPHRAG